MTKMEETNQGCGVRWCVHVKALACQEQSGCEGCAILQRVEERRRQTEMKLRPQRREVAV